MFTVQGDNASRFVVTRNAHTVWTNRRLCPETKRPIYSAHNRTEQNTEGRAPSNPRTSTVIDL